MSFIFPFNEPSIFLCAGPFMVVLFAKLENMLQNSLYVNILLTGIVAQLACYPQPLLRSFLLNTNMVFQPSVKSLIQVHCTLTYNYIGLGMVSMLSVLSTWFRNVLQLSSTNWNSLIIFVLEAMTVFSFLLLGVVIHFQPTSLLC